MTALEFFDVLNDHLDQLISINAPNKHPDEMNQYFLGKVDGFDAVKKALETFKPFIK